MPNVDREIIGEEIYLNGLQEEALSLVDVAVLNACLRSHYHPTPEDIRRLSQRLMLRLLENDCRRLRSFKNQSSFRTWLQTLANNYVSRQLQRERRTQSLNELPTDFLIIPPVQENRIWQEQKMKLLDNALNNLTNRERQLFDLFRLGWKAEDISRETGIKVASVYCEKHSIVKKLRRLCDLQEREREQKRK
jgi:RNA polymerase sigma factor (sigma-70 family)